MNKEIINEWLSDIATPTGISYSGDQTISESMDEKIVDYVSNLEQALDEIQNILKPKYILDATSIKPDGDFYEENGVIFQDYNANARIQELSTFVYQMPKE